MFLDERIIIEKGKIFRKINILAIIIALIFLICRLSIYSECNQKINLLIFSTEIVTIIASVISLLIGELGYSKKIEDERTDISKFQYYSKQGKVLLFSIILGYAISMIVTEKRFYLDLNTNYIILTFELIGIIYIYYQFKKKDININYSFIENYNGIYYKKVFKNIGLVSSIIISIYLLCGILTFLIYHSLSYILSFLLAGLFSSLVISVQYLVISFIEKADYDDELNEIKISFKYVSIILLLMLAVSVILVIIANSYLYENVEIYKKIFNVLQNLSFYEKLFLGIYLAYLLSFFKDNESLNKSISLYIIFIIGISVIDITLETINIITTQEYLQKGVLFYHKYNMTIKTITWVNYILNIIKTIIYGFIVFNLVKEGKYKMYLLFLPGIVLACNIILIFLNDLDAEAIKTINVFYGIITICQWGILSMVLLKNKKDLYD